MPVALPISSAIDLVGRHAHRQRVAVVAIGRDHMIARLAGANGAHGNRFLADVEVEKAADFTPLVEL